MSLNLDKTIYTLENIYLQTKVNWWDSLMLFCFTLSFMIFCTGIILGNTFYISLSLFFFGLSGVVCQVGESSELKKIRKLHIEQRKNLRALEKQ